MRARTLEPQARMLPWPRHTMTTNNSAHELNHPFTVRNPRRMAVEVPFTGDVEDWLVRLEVYIPMDEERMRDLERWRRASDGEHGEALASLLSVVDAMRETLQPRAPLEVRFPRP